MGVLALVIPILPGLLWMWIFYRTDRFEPEPKRLVFATFLLGIAAVLPALGGERLAQLAYPLFQRLDAPDVPASAAPTLLIGCFLVIGPCEELAKFGAVRLFIYRHAEFNEPLDGIIYASAAALGFASLENVLYVIDFTHGMHVQWGTLMVRTVLALPGHVIFAATTWGFALGRAKFRVGYRVWPMVLLGSLLHGSYDFVLLYPPTRALVLLYMSIMAAVLVRQIRVLQSDSPFAPWVAHTVSPPPESIGGGMPPDEPAA